jgi:hypothetical protein
MKSEQTEYSPLTAEAHELAVSKYLQQHSLLNSENLPFDTMPFRQIVVMLRFLQNRLGVHAQDYPAPNGEDLLYAVDTCAIWVNHALSDPSCWCGECEHKRIADETPEQLARPLGECPACGAEISTPLHNDEIFRCRDCGVELVREVNIAQHD